MCLSDKIALRPLRIVGPFTLVSTTREVFLQNVIIAAISTPFFSNIHILPIMVRKYWAVLLLLEINMFDLISYNAFVLEPYLAYLHD